MKVKVRKSPEENYKHMPWEKEVRSEIGLPLGSGKQMREGRRVRAKPGSALNVTERFSFGVPSVDFLERVIKANQ